MTQNWSISRRPHCRLSIDSDTEIEMKGNLKAANRRIKTLSIKCVCECHSDSAANASISSCTVNVLLQSAQIMKARMLKVFRDEVNNVERYFSVLPLIDKRQISKSPYR
jgi:hypothetical protein